MDSSSSGIDSDYYTKIGFENYGIGGIQLPIPFTQIGEVQNTSPIFSCGFIPCKISVSTSGGIKLFIKPVIRSFYYILTDKSAFDAEILLMKYLF